jgi:hypothetical protein
MRNATSILLFGASSLVLMVAACGGGGSGQRPDEGGAGTNNASAGTSPSGAGTNPGSAGNSSGAGTSGGGEAATCAMTPGSKKGDGTDTSIDEIDDTDTMFAPAGTGVGSWDFSKDTSTGTITPAGTTALMPEAGGQAGSALHVTGTGLLGWGASLAAFLNGPMGSFDASMYGGVAFYIKGTATTQDGANKVMVLARMPDVLPGANSCCDNSAMPVAGKECYSAHRVVIDITPEWTEVKIAWKDFASPTWGLGSTIALDPNRIRDINFSFNHDTAMATGDGTSFDVWVDGLRFLKSDEMGNLKPGGSAGTGNTAGSGGSGGSGGGGNEGGAQ